MIGQLNHLGDGGIALGIVTGAVLIIYLLAGVAKLWLEVSRENNAARNANDAKKTAVDEEQTAVIKEVGQQLQLTRTSQEAVGTTLLQIAQVLRDHDTRAQQVLEEMKQARDEMRQVGLRRDIEVKALPGALREAVEPQLATIAQALDLLKKEMTAELERMSSTIPGAVRSVLEQETKQYTEQIVRRLEHLGELIEAVQQVQRESLALAATNNPPGEQSKSPEPEATEVINEEKQA